MPSTATPPPEESAANGNVEQRPDEMEIEDPEEDEGVLGLSHPFDIEEQRITLLPGGFDTAASFQFEDEDHTLGNALRYLIMKNPDVEFCGYTIPHPSENKMTLRIQTYDTTDVFDALQRGLDDLMALCDVVSNTFTDARDESEASEGQ